MGLKFPSVAEEGLFIDRYKETSSGREFTASSVALETKARSSSLISRAACEKQIKKPVILQLSMWLSHVHLFFDSSGT